MTTIAFDRIPTITSYSEAEQVLRARDLRVGMSAEADPVMRDVLQKLHGDEHFDRRRMESGLFRREFLVRYELDALVPAVRQEIERARLCCRGHDRVRADVLVIARTALTRQTGLLVGLDGVDGPESAERLRVIAERLRNAASVTWSTRNHAEVMREAVEALNELRRDFYEPSLAARRKRLQQGNTAGASADLLTTLLIHHGADWDDDLWARETALFVLASSGTLSNAISHSVVEIADWLKLHPEDQGRLGDLDFLFAAASESLRLHPSPPFIARVAVNDTEVAGRSYRAGEYLRIDLGAVNRDPGVFGPHADRFDPLRVVEGVRPYGLAFGGGAHMCIGRPIAIGSHTTAPDGDSAIGGLVRVLVELYRVGIELDSDRPPIRSAELIQHLFDAVPVVFTRLSPPA